MKLLVSVRNIDEALLASSAGVDIVDLKEPMNGSLGSVAPAVAKRVSQEVTGNCSLSLACGELMDMEESIQEDWLSSFQFAKIGLAGCGKRKSFSEAWLHWSRQLPNETRPVMVAYGDHLPAAAPHPDELIELALGSASRWFLFDTFSKDGRTLFDFISIGELKGQISKLKSANLKIAIAGSIKKKHLGVVTRLGVDVVAVRGAVCTKGQRAMKLDRLMLQEFQQEIKRQLVQKKEARNRCKSSD